MRSALTVERVRNDIDVISRAGLTVDEFLDEATAALERVIPWSAACIALNDPSTRMLTTARKYGALIGSNPHDPLFALIEYGSEEHTTFANISRAATPALGMHDSGHGEAGSSERMDRLVRPLFGFSDELRLAFCDELGMWGGTAIYRSSEEPLFTADEIAFAASLSATFARGVRGGLLADLGQTATEEPDHSGPAVIIIDRNDEVLQISAGAQHRLTQLGDIAHSTDPIGMVYGLVAAARRMSHTSEAALPRIRVRTPSGVWLLLHASPLASRDGSSGDVVVTIEEARPPEIIDLVVAAFGLTAREHDVVRFVLAGLDTKAIAASLHLSAYTVQDHLKSIFDKAGVRSRRELISRIYFDQYLPRLNQPVGPSGWFLG